MKLFPLFAGLGLSFAFAATANAKIVNGTMNAYFSKVYATDLTGQVNLPQYDSACNSKHWFMVNTQFYVDYRVNTDTSSHVAFFNYANAEHTLNGSYVNGRYVFKTEQLSQSLKDMHAKSLNFTVESNFYYGSAQLVFEATPTVTTHSNGQTNCPPGCGCDCHKQPQNSYQCVLST